MIHTYNLAALVGGQVFAFLLVFTRFGAAFMFLPGIGETYVTPRARLILALSIALLLTPVIGPHLPKQPEQVAALVALLAVEATLGVFLGLIIRLMLSAIDFAGQLIALQLGISSAIAFNPALATQGTLPGALLGLLALLLVFATGLHHLFIEGIAASYNVMPAGLENVNMGALGQAFVSTVSESFKVSIMMASPFVILGMVFNVGLALLNRLQPALQIFFVGLPLQIYFGLAVFATMCGAIMSIWLTHAADAFGRLGLLGSN